MLIVVEWRSNRSRMAAEYRKKDDRISWGYHYKAERRRLSSPASPRSSRRRWYWAQRSESTRMLTASRARAIPVHWPNIPNDWTTMQRCRSKAVNAGVAVPVRLGNRTASIQSYPYRFRLLLFAPDRTSAAPPFLRLAPTIAQPGTGFQAAHRPARSREPGNRAASPVSPPASAAPRTFRRRSTP